VSQQTHRKTRTLARLGLQAKLSIVSGIVLFALAVTCFLLFGFLSQSIEDARLERQGLEYLRGLRHFAHSVQAHRSATLMTAMNVPAFEKHRNIARGDADKYSATIAEIDARIGDSLAVQGAWKSIAERWTTIAAMSHKRAEDVVASYAELIVAIHALGTRIKSNARLAIDPDARSAQLRDFLVELEPKLSEELEQARGLGTRLLSRIGASAEETTRFIELYGITGVRANEVLQLETIDIAALRERVEDSKKATAASRKQVADIFLGQNDAALTADKFYTIATVALDHLEAVASTVDFEFDRMLIARLDRVQMHRALVSAGVTATLLLAVALAIAVMRDLLRRLNYAGRIAARVANGDLSIDARDAGSDEIGRVVVAFQTVASRMTEFVHAQAVMAKRHDAGDIDYRVDASAFPGVYGELAAQLNTLVASNLDLTFQFMHTVQRYAQGDFDARMPALPGRKAEITTAAEGVRGSLAAVSSEIHVLVNAAGRGEFHARGDTSRYSAEFAEMVGELNTLMQTCESGIADANRMFHSLAEGDLTPRITAQYAGMFGELKENANRTMVQLGGLIEDIRTAADSIDIDAGEIARGNVDLASRTEMQSTSLDTTTRSIADITQSTRSSADSAANATTVASEAATAAKKGGVSMQQCVATMNEIADSSKRVQDIIGVIDGIAFQTNILALNAAVEAARAGEQGRGFAVVATEVRNLAGRSAAAAKEVKELITSSVERIGSGVDLVEATGNDMRDITDSVARVNGMIGDIAAAAREQRAEIEQVNDAVVHMDGMTRQNATLVDEAAAASERMREHARDLSAAVAVFKVHAGVTRRSNPEARHLDRAA
jgi:methyl-accepting chemotaxis protein